MGPSKWEKMIHGLKSQKDKVVVTFTLMNPLPKLKLSIEYSIHFWCGKILDCNRDYIYYDKSDEWQQILSLDALTFPINLAYLEILDENNNIIKQFTDKKLATQNINIYPLLSDDYQWKITQTDIIKQLIDGNDESEQSISSDIFIVIVIGNEHQRGLHTHN